MPVSSDAADDALRARFVEAWQAIGGEQAEAVYAGIAARYGEHRHYHDLGHIRSMFEKADQLLPERRLSPELVLAIFLHDAIYDPQRHDNEKRSAALAVELLGGRCAESAEKIAELILVTQHHNSTDPEAQLLIDLDLWSLGMEAAGFDANVEKLIREFSHLGRERFLHGQAEYLKPFLEREYIYYTEPFRRHFEAAARRNLERFIQANQELV